MRIAFVSANREVLPDPVVPLGVTYIMASTPAGHDKKLIDLCWEADPLEAVKRELVAFAPDLVAMGMRNIQNSDYSGTRDNLEYYDRVVAAIRAATPAPLVLGGGGFSVIPRGLMERLRPDYAIAGEAELAWRDLLARLASGERDATGVGGVWWRSDGQVVQNPAQPAFTDLDALPPPDKSQLDARYFTEVGTDSIQTKRGCALRCEYCTYPTIEGRAVRQRDPVRVADEMVAAKAQKPGLRHFFIVDSNFNIPPRHAKAVCRELIARRFDTPWTCYANPLGFDAELADLMARAGCVGMEVGSDSGCDDVLERLKKGFKTDKIRAMRHLCAAAGLKDCHTFILGTQGETLADVRRTLDFLHELSPYAAILMVWTDDYEALDPALAASRRGFRQEVLEVVRAEAKANPRWIVPPLGVNFDPRMFRLLRRRGLTGPLWQHIHLVDRHPRDAARAAG